MMLDPIQTMVFIIAASVLVILSAAAGVVAFIIGYGLWQAWRHVRRWV